MEGEGDIYVPNAQISELCGVGKDLHEGIDEGVLRWFAMRRGSRGVGSPRESI